MMSSRELGGEHTQREKGERCPPPGFGHLPHLGVPLSSGVCGADFSLRTDFSRCIGAKLRQRGRCALRRLKACGSHHQEFA